MEERRKIDYAFKSKVLREHSDLVKQVNKASKEDYKNIRFYIENCAEGVVLPNQSNLDDLYVDCCLNGLKNEYNECLKINKAYYERYKRLRLRVESIITSGTSLFLTLTFNDNTLSKTSAQTRRKLVQRYLKQYNCKYVANIDFGAKNHREHYHALIGINRVDNKPWNEYGNIDFEVVRLKNESDSTKLSKYISKLTNHAIKETTKRSALMYSR